MAENIVLKPKTFKEKRQNFWYHYKWHTIAVIFIAVVLAVCITQCAKKTKPDLRIMVSLSKPLTSEMTDQLSELLAPYAEDLNGDGQVYVEIIDCSYDASGNSQTVQAMQSKFQAEVASGEVLLFINDDTTFSRSADIDLFAENEGFLSKDKRAYSLVGTSIYDKLNENDYLPKSMYLCKRRISGTSAEKKKGVQDTIAAADSFVEKLIKAMAPPEKADAQIAVYRSGNLDESLARQISLNLRLYAEDINGDGTIYVKCTDLSYPNAASKADAAARISELRAGGLSLLLVDRASLDELKADDLLVTRTDFLNDAGKAYNLADGKLFNLLKADFSLPRNFYLVQLKSNAATPSAVTDDLITKLIADNPQPSAN